MDMYLVCKVKKRGVDTLAFPLLTEGLNVAEHVKNQPGVGKPFFVLSGFGSDGQPSGVDFTNAPTVSLDTAANQAAIDDMLANPPWDAFSYS